MVKRICSNEPDYYNKANAAEVVQYESEVIKVIRGESKLNADLLNKLYEEAQAKAIESDLKIKSLEKRIAECEEKRGSLTEQYDSMRSWATTCMAIATWRQKR